MHIVLVDDSIPFDGQSPHAEPLGGPEKAFAGLASALARRGHRVQVFNRARASREIEGAVWEGWERPRPEACEVLIAYRRPELLGFVAQAARKVLWLAAPAEALAAGAERALLESHRPTLVFMSEAHRAGYAAPSGAPAAQVIAPGVAAAYGEATPPVPQIPPYAVATSHPSLGLGWLIDLWRDRIHPLCPHAELRLYSAILDRAAYGVPAPAAFKEIAELALLSRDKGVAIHRPGADPAMAEAYRGARVHLHPGDAREVYCFTLAESQACGTPAVARPYPAAAEAIADGRSGHLASEEGVFAQQAIALLEDDAAYVRLSAGARERGQGWGWERAAAAFEAIWL